LPFVTRLRCLLAQRSTTARSADGFGWFYAHCAAANVHDFAGDLRLRVWSPSLTSLDCRANFRKVIAVSAAPGGGGALARPPEEVDQSLTGIHLLRSGDDPGREYRKILKLLEDWSDKNDPRYVYEFTHGANCNLDLARGNGRHSPTFDLARHLFRDTELRKQFFGEIEARGTQGVDRF
jgi:hypothetical protein